MIPGIVIPTWYKFLQDVHVPKKPEPKSALLTLYAVRNKEGNWFRAKGYSGSGATWVSDLEKAKIYAKIGQARAQVTFFAKTYPSYDIPDLVALDVFTMRVVPENVERTKKSVEKIKKRAEDRAQRYAEYIKALKRL